MSADLMITVQPGDSVILTTGGDTVFFADRDHWSPDDLSDRELAVFSALVHLVAGKLAREQIARAER